MKHDVYDSIFVDTVFVNYCGEIDSESPYMIQDILLRGLEEEIPKLPSLPSIGLSPSGKAQDFDSWIHWFKSSLPSLLHDAMLAALIAALIGHNAHGLYFKLTGRWPIPLAKNWWQLVIHRPAHEGAIEHE